MRHATKGIEQRNRIRDALAAAPEGLATSALAAQTGTTIQANRHHIEVLEAAGLVTWDRTASFVRGTGAAPL